MHYRSIFCVFIFSALLMPNALAQRAGDTDEIDQELVEIRRTLAEMSEILSRMAVTLDRLDDTLNRRQAGVNLPATRLNEDADMLPVLFPPAVERAMIPDGQMYRAFKTLKRTQETPYGSTRSILEVPLKPMQKLWREK